MKSLNTAMYMLRQPVMYPFVNDLRVQLRTGMWGATGVVYVGLEEYQDMAFCAHLLRPQDVFVDVGACFGSYSLLASGVAGARSIAFEPNPVTAQGLRENIRLNSLGDRVEIRAKAVGSEHGTVMLTSELRAANHIVGADDAADTSQVAVPLTRLDDELEQTAPALIKIDVEGYEQAVLDGAQAVLRKESLLAVILEDVGLGRRYGPSSDQHARMLGLGFRSYRYEPGTRELVDLDGEPNRAGFNTLYVRNPALVKERLAGARPFTVLGRTI